MADLPWEVICLICSAVAPHDLSPKETLRALSQVSRVWYEAALPLLYHRLLIGAGPRQRMEEVINGLLDHAVSKQYLQYLRRLDIGNSQIPGEGLLSYGQQNWWPGVTSWTSFPEEEIPKWGRNVFYPRKDSWEPIIRLVSLVQRLAELHLAVLGPFLDRLLEALHRYHPSCRLHLSLFGQCILPTDNVVSSPCLYAVYVYYFRHHYQGDLPEDFWDDAVISMVSAAPCLQEMTFQRFMAWRQKIDLASLLSLNVGEVHDPEVLRAIMETDLGQFLPRLERFSICFLPRSGATSTHYWFTAELLLLGLPPLQYLSLVGSRDASFVDRVLAHHGPRLHSLNISRLKRSNRARLNPFTLAMQNGSNPVTPDYALPLYEIHGTCFTAEEIQQFAKKCPVLEDLQISIQRMHGRSRETHIYQSLGNFPALVNLSLGLVCDPPPAEDDDEEDYLGDPSDPFRTLCVPSEQTGRVDVGVGYLRRKLVNNAVDDVLVLAIFETVLSSQSTRWLQTLHVTKDHGFAMFETVLAPFLDDMTEFSWLITRAGLDSPSERDVRQLSLKPQRVAREEYTPGRSIITPDIRRIVEPLWPMGDQGPFTWSSLPLQMP